MLSAGSERVNHGGNGGTSALSIRVSELFCAAEGAAGWMKTNAVLMVIKAQCSQHYLQLIPSIHSPSAVSGPLTLSLFLSLFTEIFQGYQTAHMHNWNQVSLVKTFCFYCYSLIISLETSYEDGSLWTSVSGSPLSPLISSSYFLLTPASPLNKPAVSSLSCQVRVLLSLRRWIARPSPSRPPWVPACWGTPPSTCQDSSQWVTAARLARGRLQASGLHGYTVAHGGVVGERTM